MARPSLLSWRRNLAGFTFRKFGEHAPAAAHLAVQIVGHVRGKGLRCLGQCYRIELKLAVMAQKSGASDAAAGVPQDPILQERGEHLHVKHDMPDKQAVCCVIVARDRRKIP